tara:strand:+ start:2212 stop:3069 length:858 start_codon:yes stop_codon:yes gene_type:complete
MNTKGVSKIFDKKYFLLLLLVLFISKILNYFYLIKLKILSKFNDKKSIEITGVSRSGSSLFEYILSKRIDAICVGEIHYKYLNDTGLGKFDYHYRSKKIEEFYSSIILTKDNFLNYILRFTNKDIIISSSKNYEYLKRRKKEKNLNNLNLIIVKNPTLQIKSYPENLSSLDKTDEYLFSAFQKYFMILLFSLISLTPFIIIRYEDLFTDKKREMIFKKLSYYLNAQIKNFDFVNQFYLPINGSKTFNLNKPIIFDEKKDIVLNEDILKRINNNLHTKFINLIRYF